MVYTPYKFTGKEEDPETGLIYFGARYYDAAVGIWHGVDPMAEKYTGISSFTYVFNNPIKFIDPTGLEGVEPEEGTEPLYKISNLNSWNPSGKSNYGSAVVLPLDLNDHNGANNQRYKEALNLGVPIIQVNGIEGFANALKDLKEQGVAVNTFVVSGHGSSGFFYIGDDPIKANTDVSALKDGLNGCNVLLTHCRVTAEKTGFETLQNFAKQTNTITYSSDHYGWSLTTLNGFNFPVLGIKNKFPFIKVVSSDGAKYNNFHFSNRGGFAKSIYNLNINYSTGGVSGDAIERY